MEQDQKTPTTDSPAALKRLNIGCGSHKIPGAINLDINPKVNPECVFDLETIGTVVEVEMLHHHEFDHYGQAHAVASPIKKIATLPFQDNEFDIIVASHVLEHIRNILPVMQELHRVTKPGGILQIRVPYGGCSIAFEDPTHVRQMFPKSFEYFGQMAYNAADYNYRGDWEVVDMLLAVRDEFRGMPPDELAFMMERAFNVADEMFVVMKAIKPIRVADGVPRSLQIKYGFVSDIHDGMVKAAQGDPGANDPSFH